MKNGSCQLRDGLKSQIIPFSVLSIPYLRLIVLLIAGNELTEKFETVVSDMSVAYVCLHDRVEV